MERPSKIIETKQASLDTMSVTIKALHVNGKQMTLAVFRQLPMICPYNDNGKPIEADFWGLVRYQIKEDGDTWIVLSTNGILYRSTPKNPLLNMYYLNNYFRKVHDICDQQQINQELEIFYDQKRIIDESLPYPEPSSYSARLAVDCERQSQYPSSPKGSYDHGLIHKWNELDWFDVLHDNPPTQEQIDLLFKAMSTRVNYYLQAEETKKNLLALPQLFIAV